MTDKVIDVIVEIPYKDILKCEWDEKAGRMRVDRPMPVTMTYPGNYGFIPNTISGDSDPVDVLIVNNYMIRQNCIIACRVIGALITTDEKGRDEKVLAVPVCDNGYSKINEYTDLDTYMLDTIKHFFSHYKDIDRNNGKWVKVEDYVSSSDTMKLIDNYRT